MSDQDLAVEPEQISIIRQINNTNLYEEHLLNKDFNLCKHKCLTIATMAMVQEATSTIMAECKEVIPTVVINSIDF